MSANGPASAGIPGLRPPGGEASETRTPARLHSVNASSWSPSPVHERPEVSNAARTAASNATNDAASTTSLAEAPSGCSSHASGCPRPAASASAAVHEGSDALAATMLLSLLGVLAGIWSQKFDHIAAVTNFVVTPLAFLSGTFYTVDRLPEPWHAVALANPFFYMIDGFRYGFLGHADGGLWTGVAAMLAANLALGALCHRLFATGYRLRA